MDYEDKRTQKKVPYVRFKTSEGWMSCFNAVANEALKKFEGRVACVEVETKDDFTNITKCYGEADELVTARRQVGELRELIPQDEKPEVVKPGIVIDKVKPIGNGYRTPEQMIMCEMMHDAKDVFCAMMGEVGFKDTPEESMKYAIKLVKQAKEAFE